MKAQRMLTALALLTLSVSSGAKDLGTWGNVFEPAEQDILLFIQNRLKGMEQSGELDRLREEATERVKKHAVRPRWRACRPRQTIVRFRLTRPLR